jgi:F-type H+-transporting ATPase subunit b
VPQLHFADFPPQLVWLAISFVLLYLLMSRVALPRVAEVLEARDERIREDLERAGRLKAEAEKTMAEYESALTKARAEAQEATRRSEAEGARIAAERQAEQAQALARQLKSAENAITAAKDQAMGHLRAVAGEAARAVTQKLLGAPVSQADGERAAAAALAERRA